MFVSVTDHLNLGEILYVFTAFKIFNRHHIAYKMNNYKCHLCIVSINKSRSSQVPCGTPEETVIKSVRD